jgi:prepilin-type N-terminal cleavage/methylation domain-containing protein
MKRRAFTLVEVILAILIISAIMTVLLYFYQRSVEVRQNVLEEAEFLSVNRMLMEQMTTELRAARVVEDQFVGFEGSSNSITFVTTSIPQTSRWMVSTNDALVLPPVTDLKRVSYRLLSGTNIVDVRGIDRTEEILTGSTFTTLVTTNSTDYTNSMSTNLVSDVDTNLLGTNDVQLIRRPLTERIKLLQFRYWGGTNWLDSWTRLELPLGVEITLGADPAPAETSTPTTTETTTAAAEDLPPNVFRRVVYLPNSVPAVNKPSTESESADSF